jgi:hypothetical protein
VVFQEAQVCDCTWILPWCPVNEVTHVLATPADSSKLKPRLALAARREGLPLTLDFKANPKTPRIAVQTNVSVLVRARSTRVRRVARVCVSGGGPAPGDLPEDPRSRESSNGAHMKPQRLSALKIAACLVVSWLALPGAGRFRTAQPSRVVAVSRTFVVVCLFLVLCPPQTEDLF